MQAETVSVVVVTGVSGAGRSTALAALEDLGFFAVDNLPPPAFEPALQACKKAQLKRVAFGIDVRVRSFLDGTLEAIALLRADSNIDFTLLFLDASDAVLLARFSSTRRPHPLRGSDRGQSLAVVDGIKLERELLAPLRANASLVLATTELTVHELRRRVVEVFQLGSGQSRRMIKRFLSFGFKYGAPTDVDLMFDVRFLQNPYFVPALRPQSGLDSDVREFVRSRPAAPGFIEHVEALLRYTVPKYEQEGKSYLTVGLGCTGGRHRSVAVAEWLVERLGEDLGPPARLEHRDLERVSVEAFRRAKASQGSAGRADRTLPGGKETTE